MNQIKKVCTEMLSQRNWHLNDSDDSDHYTGTTENRKTFYVFFCQEPKLNIANVKECIKTLNDLQIEYGIIVYKESITASAKKVLGNITDIKIELFTFNDLAFNITKHKYACPHIRLSKAAQTTFVAKMGQDIPVLLKTDPMCRFYNFDRGDIIKIVRKHGPESFRIVK